MATPPGEAHRIRFEDVWRAFMRHAPVRAWLFDRAPPSRSQAYACVTNQPEPLSFCFDAAADAVRAEAAASAASSVSADSLHDFRELATVLYHASGTALGVTFGHADRQPILPVAHQFTGDEDYKDNTVIVRRCAIRRASPHSRHLLRLQLDWFRSGVLGVDYCFIPATAPDLRPSVGFAVFGYRVFKRTDAELLFAASLAPSPDFLDGSTTLLAPSIGYVSLEGCDSQFQTPCMYCAYRNNVLCDCPAPLRRRVVDEGTEYGPATRDLTMPLVDSQMEEDYDDEHTINEMVWNYYSHRMKLSLSNGTLLTNWRFVRPTMPSLSNVVVAHIVPYSVLLSKPGSESPMIQRVLTVLGLQSNMPQLLTAAQHREISDNVLITDVTEMVDEIAQSADIPDQIDAAAMVAHGQPDAIFFDEALLQLGGDTCGSASSPGAIGEAFNGSNAQLEKFSDSGVSRKRQRAATRDLELDEPKRMHTFSENAKTRGRNAIGARNLGGGDAIEVKRTDKKETRKWQCNQCSAVIRGKRSNLTRHVQNKHTKVRPFECSLRDCDKRFQTRLNLKRHQSLVHAGRPHTCSGCARSFKTSEKLERHVTTVHQPGAEPLACPLCGNCYGKRSTLSRHVAHVHKAMSDVTTDPDPDFTEKELPAALVTASILPDATDPMASRVGATPTDHLLGTDAWNSRSGAAPVLANTVTNLV